MSAPEWVPYNGLAHNGRCDTCRAVATQALVRMHDGVAFTLLRLACTLHGPEPTKSAADDPDDPWVKLRRSPR